VKNAIPVAKGGPTDKNHRKQLELKSKHNHRPKNARHGSNEKSYKFRGGILPKHWKSQRFLNNITPKANN
jgi:hypothetical protein